jgi:TonB-linked SusC/RagA family outer membrane protein
MKRTMMHDNFRFKFSVKLTMLSWQWLFIFLSGSFCWQESFAQVSATDSAKRANSNLSMKELTGTVKDAITKEVIAGARVIAPFGTGFSYTDSRGRYKLKVPSFNGDVTVVADGYASSNFTMRGKGSLDVFLHEAGYPTFDRELSTPTGVQSFRSLTLPISTQQVEGQQHHFKETPDTWIQGRFAGLYATRRSGSTTMGAELLIRGYHSLYAGSTPLIVIDNIPYDVNDYGTSIISNHITNPLSYLDPKEIEEITILKDAASIYGAKGANGVIMIKTVKAREQATRIDFSVHAGVNLAPASMPMMNADQYRGYLSDIYQSRGFSTDAISQLPFMTQDPSTPDFAAYQFDQNWQDKVFRNTMGTNYAVRVTGGDNVATYGLMMSYLQNDEVIRGSDLRRYNTRFNSDFNFSKRLTGTAQLSFAYNEENIKQAGADLHTNPVLLGLVKAPFLNNKQVNEFGVESPNLADVDIFGVSNPSAVIEKVQGYNRYYRFNGSFALNYAFSKSLTLSSTIGILFDKVRENFFVPSVGIVKDTLQNAVANNRMGTQVKRLSTFFNDTRLQYNKQIGTKSALSSALGLRYQKNEAEQDFALGFNSATDDLVNVQNGNPLLRQVGGDKGAWNWMNIYFNLNYQIQNRFFLSVASSMDGSSRFGPEAAEGVKINGNRFAVFPSISGAWLLSSEPFMANAKLNALKLRASYSIAGNDNIGNYAWRQTYTSQNLLGMQGLVRSGVSNPALQWESRNQWNLGLDLSARNNRFTASFDVYRSTSNNMLVYEPLETVTGFDQLLTNDGRMRNWGWEISAFFRAVEKKSWQWDISANLGQYKTKLLAVPDDEIITKVNGANILSRVNEAATLFYGYRSQGVFSSQIDAQSANLRTRMPDGSLRAFEAGDIRFQDVNGDRIIDESDMSVIGNPHPELMGSVQQNWHFGRFHVGAMVFFSYGNDVYNYVRSLVESTDGYSNQMERVTGRWRTDFQETNIPRANFGDPLSNNRFSDRWIEDGSYVRLRELTLQYDLFFKSKTIRNASVYLSGINLVTLTKYRGYDPEFFHGNSIFQKGIDTGFEPIHRSVSVGVRMGL